MTCIAVALHLTGSGRQLHNTQHGDKAFCNNVEIWYMYSTVANSLLFVTVHDPLDAVVSKVKYWFSGDADSKAHDGGESVR